MGHHRHAVRTGFILATTVAAAAGLAIPATPAGAILPPAPPVCAFTMANSVSTLGAAGTLLLQLPTKPAVASQRCTATVTVTSTIANGFGATAPGVTPNPLIRTLSLDYVPDRLPPSIDVLWAGYCTTSGGPAELITRAGGQVSVAPLGVQEPCADKGVVPSSLETTALVPVSDVSIAAAPGGTGYRVAADDGEITVKGTPSLTVPSPASGQVFPSGVGPAVGIAATPAGNGDWVASADGDVVDYGSAVSHGSLLGTPLNQPVVGIAADPVTGGYWLAAADGGVFSFDAPFHGSAGSIHLNAPVVGIAATPDGGGYWLAAADGGVFSFGDAALLRLGRKHPPQLPRRRHRRRPPRWILAGGRRRWRLQLRRPLLRLGRQPPPQRRGGRHRGHARRWGLLVGRGRRGGVHLRRRPLLRDDTPQRRPRLSRRRALRGPGHVLAVAVVRS